MGRKKKRKSKSVKGCKRRRASRNVNFEVTYNGKDKNLVGLTLFKGKTRAGEVSCCWRPKQVSRLSLSRC